MNSGPLSGVRVIDITLYMTGPLTTQALADCGAEVIRVDTRSRLGARGMQGSVGGGLHQSTNKLSITLNFATPEGLELLYRLVARSDVVVENHAGGVLRRRGLGYDDLKKVKPDIIMLSSCMQGQTGPYAEHAASGHKLTALSGFNQIAGWPDREPGWLGAYTDFIAPRYNTIAVMAALDFRSRTGKGQYLDISQNEAGMQFMAPLILDYTVNKRVAGRKGNRCEYAAPHNAYPCFGDDRWCTIAVFNDAEWRSFCGVVGRDGWLEDARFSTVLGRKEHEDELDALVAEWTSTRTAEEVMVQMQTAGVASGIVETARDQLDLDPQMKYREFFREIDFPGFGLYHTTLGANFLMASQPYEPKRGPVVGEHNEYVFKQIVGLSQGEYDTMVADKIIH
jgi:benzylsuccinate CoA-transferase BbsF subunit